MNQRNPGHGWIEILGYRVYIGAVGFKGSSRIVAEAYSSMSSECKEEAVVAGLKGTPASQCALAVAFIHALEGRFRGSRIKNLSILFIMELYGFRQVNQVVEHVRDVDYIALLSLRPECIEEGYKRLLELGVEGEYLGLRECDPRELSRLVTRSVRHGVRLE
ncbi:MAG: hypothetical protein F7C38_07855 [Desulfurococcales archaeon]|nr:hypothetical protein [Desulfurococcales archaeon]